MAPNSSKPSNLIFSRVEIGTVIVKALVDSGAEASCCSHRWYEQHKHILGGVVGVSTRVIGIENSPIPIQGRTQALELVWDDSKAKISLLVVPTLYDHDVILGMDVMGELGVRIDARRKRATPTILNTYVRPEETWKIPARSSVFFKFE